MFRGTITTEREIPPKERPRLGFLYPRGGSSFEYYHFAEHFNGNVRCYLVGGMHSYGGDKTHYEEPLFKMGAIENLSYPALSMKPLQVDAGLWCSTSASFIGGLGWSRDQAKNLADILGAPASNTSLAYVDAIQFLNVDKVAVLASYPRDVMLAFKRFLGEAGIEVADSVHLDADAGEDAYNFSLEFMVEKAAQLDLTRAGALLVPDTAMAAFPLMRELEKAYSVPVLTANQVTIWKGLNLAGAKVATDRYGRLFSSA